MSILEGKKLKLTYSDFVGFPEDGKRHEIIDGDHYVTPSPETYHQSLSFRLGVQLYHQIEEPKRGRVFPAPMDVLLSQVDIVEPDTVVVLEGSRARITQKNIEGPPDLLVEILSPSTSERDRGLKKSLYERAGVPEYWVIDPRARRLEQYVLEGGRYALAGSHEAAFDCRTIPGVRIDLSRVW
jgi:Uma2 family endonuclease